MEVDVGTAMDILTQLVVLIGGLGAIVGGAGIALKRWIRKTVSEPMQQQMMPNGGRPDTTRSLVEEIAEKSEHIVQRLDTIDHEREADKKLVQEALETANQALTISGHTGDRLDKMIERQERHNG